MKKILLILSALLLTAVGASAQTTAYEFKAQNWVSCDAGRITENDIEYNTDGTITLTAGDQYGWYSYANCIALGNMSSMATSGSNTANYYITSEQKYFVVKGKDLSKTSTDSYLWWMNGYNSGMQASPDYIVELTEETTGDATGEVLFAWDCSSYLTVGADGNITLSGGTCFGLTSTDETNHKSTISYIGFYTEDELNELLTTKPYEFVCTDWVALDDHINSDLNGTTTVTYGSDSDGTANTISVKYTSGSEAGLGNMSGTMAETGANTAGYYVTKEQHWFVIQGTGLSTSGNVLWYMNYYNNGMTISPTEVATLTGGSVVLAWDLSKSQAGTNLQNDMNTLSGGTCFGLIAENSSSGFTITDINFYTEAEVEELISSAITPYEFNASDWVALGDHTGTTVTPGNNDNTISVTYTGTEAGLSNSGTATDLDTTLGITTGKYYVTKEQCWFVIVGTGLSTTNNDSQLWWMNGANSGTWYPTKFETLSDGQVLLAWDLSTMPEIDVNLQDESDLLDGWTCFGLKAANHSNGGSFTISDINFYTADEVEEMISGYDHFCTANIDHWTLTQTGGNSGVLELDTWAEQSDEKMSTPFLQYYVWEGEGGTTYLSDATISHEQLTGLTPGVYEVSMDIRIIDYAKDGDANAKIGAGTKFIANGVSEDILTGSDGTEDDYDNDGHDEVYGTYTLTCVVDNAGTLDISLDVKDATYSWIMWKNLKVQLLDTPSLSWDMTTAGWGTIVLPFASSVPEGLTAYTAGGVETTTDGDVLTLTAVNTLTANTPYILSGTANTYTFTGTTYEEANNSLSDGYLTGTFVDMDYSDFTPNSGQYLLQMHSGDTEPAFYPITSESTDVTLSAYHCYLTYSNPSGVKGFISFPNSDGEATAIEAVESEEEAEADGAIYDLSGRKVSKAVKGVYIQNGKKVLVK